MAEQKHISAYLGAYMKPKEETMENYFVRLNGVNVNEHTESKNGLTYLSWAWAWAEIKKLHPDATYTIYEDMNGCFYHTDGMTCWVKTGVTVNGIEHIEYLPVMDHRNRSIPLESVTSFDVNKAVQRSLTKACARHGLGLYIYAGEDLPEGEAQPQKAVELKLPEHGALLKELMENTTKEQRDALREKYGSFDNWPVSLGESVVKKIKERQNNA